MTLAPAEIKDIFGCVGWQQQQQQQHSRSQRKDGTAKKKEIEKKIKTL
jgi:hypothetical protein